MSSLIWISGALASMRTSRLEGFWERRLIELYFDYFVSSTLEDPGRDIFTPECYSGGGFRGGDFNTDDGSDDSFWESVSSQTDESSSTREYVEDDREESQGGGNEEEEEEEEEEEGCHRLHGSFESTRTDASSLSSLDGDVPGIEPGGGGIRAIMRRRRQSDMCGVETGSSTNYYDLLSYSPNVGEKWTGHGEAE